MQRSLPNWSFETFKYRPLPDDSRVFLDRYRIHSRRHHQPDLSGGHLMRRRGQSLEFREYSPYIPGDDIRHVDWRASIRYGQLDELLVRRFVAEERMTLIVSIDTRATMRLPKALPKLQIAGWLAESLAWIALRHNDDRVILHNLFGDHSIAPVDLRKRGGVSAIQSSLREMVERPATDGANLDGLQRYLTPTAVWLVITDFYFDLDNYNQAGILARQVTAAQDGMRWIILLDLDSWPHERILLEDGPRRIEGPGMDLERPEFQINATTLDTVGNKIREHKQQFQNQILRKSYTYIHWEWKQEKTPESVTFFRECFGEDRTLKRLFMRQTL